MKNNNLTQIFSSGGHVVTKASVNDKFYAEVIEDLDLDILNKLVQFEYESFGDMGMDEWGIVPMIRHGKIIVLKKHADEKVYGIAILMRDWNDTKKCYLYDFAIIQGYRNKGLGFAFLKTIIKTLSQRGFTEMELTVDVNNDQAIKLYKDKIGFEISELSLNEYGTGRDRYQMKLDMDRLQVS